MGVSDAANASVEEGRSKAGVDDVHASVRQDTASVMEGRAQAEASSTARACVEVCMSRAGVGDAANASVEEDKSKAGVDYVHASVGQDTSKASVTAHVSVRTTPHGHHRTTSSYCHITKATLRRHK